MATSAFKSTTKRSPIGPTTTRTPEDAGSSNRAASHHRRSRSLSRFSHRFHSEDSEDLPAPRGRFVNTVRGSGFPEISLDDLANELFPSIDANGIEDSERHRSTRRSSDVNSYAMASQRRGRSVSRHYSRAGEGKGVFDNPSERKGVSDGSSGGKGVSDGSSRRRRSLSVARYQFSDSESNVSSVRQSDVDNSRNTSNGANQKSLGNGICQKPSSCRPTDPKQQFGLRRSMSQKDLPKSHDSFSSYSSALTDDEVWDAHSSKHGIERIIQAVYAQKKIEHPTEDGLETGLYEVMRKELRHAVEEIRTELAQVMVNTKPSVENSDCLQSNNSDVDVLQAVDAIRKNYSTKLEQSEKRKHDLQAEIMAEEQRGRELSNIVRELLPDQKSTATPKRPSRARKRSNDRTRVSKCLAHEAEKYFEDFISSVEDTDISSFDGERSDASSTLGGTTKLRDPMIHCGEAETIGTPARANSLPVEMDGIVLPWLQWETSNDGSPLSFKGRKEVPVKLQTDVCDAVQGGSTENNKNNCFASSCGGWSSGGESASLAYRDLVSRFEPLSCKSHSVASGPRQSYFDMDEYLHLQHQEYALFEGWRQRQRINSGGLLLCSKYM
ncbi:PREDICTED: uncharacterized protein LOC104594334 isoform X2 [Nelumbo nucifera]|uniref:Uncharacterized protein n=2 Tax=Nelumbo nucifera TaxID=4432 RepID=A0A822XX98_NELNU|nr:PREDICTED: uncharacterized protein LOC104594334 isoform X2 [Nelumbo nucifera]DAD23749.1 TPA_asm: hypothetical protein HUJ06_025212 [Nelumbo nucifera]